MRKCEHGIYLATPEEVASGKANYCTFCTPAGNPDAKPVQFNRRGALQMTETGKLPRCPNCNNAILAISNGGKCVVCKEEFEINAPHKLRANNRQPGICPKCGSGVHKEVDRRTWECADCGDRFKAPKRLG
jgi:ribosomal protein L37AE/L43A